MRRVELEDAGGAEHLGAKVPMVIELAWDGDAFTGYIEQTCPDPDVESEHLSAGGATIRSDSVAETTMASLHFQLTEEQARQVYEAWGKVLAE